MKTYEKYKDSGIEFIGDIPQHWEVKKLKYFTFIGNGKDHKGVWDKNGKYPILGTGGKFGNSSTFLYDKPSVILGRKGTIDNPFYIAEPFWAVDTVYFTIAKESTDTKYLFYLSKTINFELYKYGSAVPSMNQETLKEIYFSTPPSKTEQIAIANYLDRKTADLDQLIAEKEQLIKLYQEEKTAIINQAVTKGIHPDVVLKDSGIEWLGDIPVHWEVKKLKYFFDLITSKTNKELKKIGLENIESKTGKFKSTKTEFAGDGVHFMINDILFGKLRPYLAKVWLATFEGKAVGDFYSFRVKKEVIPSFAKFRILDESFINVTNSSSYGSKMPRVSWEFIANLFIAFPPLEEQTQIVAYIEQESKRIDKKIKKAEKYINLLTEYRTALISEVVTGKIKVID